VRYTSTDGLPYVTWPWQQRCSARLTRTDGEYWGRCDLRTHPQYDHALERGMVIVRWSTEIRWESP
jgi:hypothetical protein